MLYLFLKCLPGKENLLPGTEIDNPHCMFVYIDFVFVSSYLQFVNIIGDFVL